MNRNLLVGAVALLAMGAACGLSCRRGPATPSVVEPAGTAKPPLETVASTEPPQAVAQGKLLYTTYFYTAAEAIIHGYEAGTSVKIVSLEKNATVYEGKVGPGETALVHTGQGVFGFLADKKASILVGTPSSCTAVGYFVKNREGSFRSGQFFSQLPSSVSANGAKVVVWAWEDTSFSMTDVAGEKVLHRGDLKAGKPFVMEADELRSLGSHVLDFRAEKPALSVEVYYDEGFVVPSRDGRASGREFYTYVGDITEGVNDLLLTAYSGGAEVKVTDIKTEEPIWSGTVGENQLVPITMKNRFVRVTANREINVTVAAYKHFTGTYAEHHFGMGAEGTGIESRFLIHTPQELWIFAYFKGTDVEVINNNTHETLWKGPLEPGQVKGLQPGFGFYSVKSSKGISVMGGSSACGGEDSPAAGLFAIDDVLYKVMLEIQQDRRNQAASEGRTLTPAAAAAPLSPAEMAKARSAVGAKHKAPMGDAEIQQRVDTIQKQ